MTDLDDHLRTLKPTRTVERFVRELASARNVQTDRRSDYLSIRPHPVGAIAVYMHHDGATLAVEPTKATRLHAEEAFRQQVPKTPATTYVRVPAAELDKHYARVLTMAIESVDWRAAGPALLAGQRRGAAKAEAQYCPTCWMQLSASGTCGCDSD